MASWPIMLRFSAGKYKLHIKDYNLTRLLVELCQTYVSIEWEIKLKFFKDDLGLLPFNNFIVYLIYVYV